MHRNPITKYRPFPTVDLPDRQWPNRVIDTVPIWCSVDLRDGNQALAIPMNVGEKIELFQALVEIGFKEIEVGFPSSSDTEFEFTRQLIEDGLIPDDVTIQVLVQAREHLIRRTFESIEGAGRAIVHLYNSTNPLQRRVTFGKSREEIKAIAVDGTKLIRELVPTVPQTDVRFEYSPESFSDTELEFSLEVCQAVMEVWEPTEEERIILNLPATVELATPNVHADQIEWFCRNMKERGKAIISLHTHNDRGTGIAATELSLMAGAERVEGTLFGNGERTGNLDIVVVALNMYSQGIDPKLHLSSLNAIRRTYERCTRMLVHERHPYAGDLVFTAFSGSHQDAIKKGMDNIDSPSNCLWQVPYLPMDPEDIGRTYKAIIRINSQSGKGGVAFIMEREFGFEMPKNMHPEFGAVVNRIADAKEKELSAEEIKEAFFNEYFNLNSPLSLESYQIKTEPDDHRNITFVANILDRGKKKHIEGTGNGPIAAFVNALERENLKNFKVADFRQHAINKGSSAEAATYLEVERVHDQMSFWGASIDGNIELAGLKALVSAYNRANREISPIREQALVSAESGPAED